jgi:hypothetical protein
MRELKYLVAVALLAMSAVLMAGAAYGADGWTVTGQDLPSAMVWDETVAASVDADNTGDTTWDSTYALVSLLSPTGPPSTIDRWGLTSVPVEGTVAPDASYTWDFEVTAPPITTVRYLAPVSPTAAGVVVGWLENRWMLAVADSPWDFVTTDMAGAEVWTAITKFPDDLPGTGGAWAAFYIDELAGRAPLVVQGYPDGTYRPGWEVTRDQMAVYMSRALNLPTAPYEGFFETTDVPEAQWAALYIEALVRADIVAGFPDGYYRPGWNVNRGQMATFVARGIWGGMDVPSGPEVGDFSDVPDYDPGPAHWAYDAIEYAVAHNVVQGYPDGTYRPDNNVTRDQMAVFVWKGFVMPIGSAVVLGGPAVTLVPPGSVYVGWSSVTVASGDDPGWAYVVFDAVRLGTALVGPDDTWDVKFELLPSGGGDPVATSTVSLDADDITGYHDEAAAAGDPYLTISWYIPGPLEGGAYQLKVSCTDDTDTFHQAGRLADLWVAPTTLSEDFEGITQLPVGWTKTGPGAWSVNPVDLGGCNLPQNQGTTIVAPGGENCLTVLPGGVAREDAAGAYSFTWVATPAIDCSGYTTVTLELDALVSCFNDYATIDASNDNGENWTTLWDWGYPDCSDSNDTYPWHEDGDPGTWLDAAVVCADPPPDWWGDLTVDLSSVAADSSRVKVRWTFVSDEAGCGCYGWLIDNVSITGS